MCLCYSLLFCATAVASASAPLSPLPTTTTIYRSVVPIQYAQTIAFEINCIEPDLVLEKATVAWCQLRSTFSLSLHRSDASTRSASCGLWLAIPPMHTLHREVEWNRFMTATKTAYALLLTLAGGRPVARAKHMYPQRCVCVRAPTSARHYIYSCIIYMEVSRINETKIPLAK